MLVRYDPFRELDRFTESLFGGPGRAPWMPMDAVRRDDRLELHFDLPGVAPDSIEVSVEHSVLTVKAERTWIPGDGDEILARERTHGTWTRQVLLGDGLDVDALEARYDGGVLTVVVPVAEQAKPRKIEIKVGSTEALEVGSTS